MATARFTGGGSLDGDVRELPDGIESATTTDRDGRSWYVLDDTSGAFQFAGYGQTGEVMTGIICGGRDRDRRDREAIAEAQQPQGCRSCGAMFADSASYAVHRERDWPGGCLPGDAFGQLELVDGVYRRR